MEDILSVGMSIYIHIVLIDDVFDYLNGFEKNMIM